jgi:DNA-binding NtrC family response regulator
VVLASDDSRFQSVMSMLLSHRGYRVSSCSSHVDSAARAVRERSGVVVIDAGASFEDAAMDAVTLRALCPELGVVLVVDEPRPWIESLPVVMKWGAFGSLFAAIERARTRDYERSHDARAL